MTAQVHFRRHVYTHNSDTLSFQLTGTETNLHELYILANSTRLEGGIVELTTFTFLKPLRWDAPRHYKYSAIIFRSLLLFSTYTSTCKSLAEKRVSYWEAHEQTTHTHNTRK